jgi:hypothetical protein
MWSLDVSQRYGLPRTVTGIASPLPVLVPQIMSVESLGNLEELEWGRMSKAAVVARFNVLSQNLFVETEENHETVRKVNALT